MQKNFKVKIYCWIKGILKILKGEFESFQEAKDFIKHSGNHKAKIYDKNNVVIHHSEKKHHHHHSKNTYA